MNIFSVFSSFVFNIYLLLALYILWKNPKSLINRFFSYASLSLALSALGDIFFYFYNDIEKAWFWYRFSSIGWSFFPGLLLCFAIIIVNKKYSIKFKTFLSIIVIISFILCYKNFKGNAFLSDKEYFDNYHLFKDNFNSIWYWINFIISKTFVIISLIIIWNWGRNSNKNRQKRQAKIMFFTIFGVFFLNLLNDNFLIHYVPEIPDLDNFVRIIWAIGMVYAIRRFKFLEFSPSMATSEIINNMKEVLFFTNTEGYIISTNSFTEQFTGYELNMLKTRHFSSFFKEQENIINNFREPNILPFSMELSLKQIDGTFIPVHFSFSEIKDRFNDLYGYILVGHDVSHEKKLEKEIYEKNIKEMEIKQLLADTQMLNEEIHASDEELKQSLDQTIELNKMLFDRETILQSQINFIEVLLDSIPNPVFYKDREGKYINVNKSFTDVFGKSKEELIGKKVFEVFPSEMASKFYEKDQELFNNGSVQIYDFIIFDSLKNENINVFFSKALFYDNSDNIAGIIGIIIDISERKKAEEKIRKTLHEKEILLREIHHRVKNNLQIIISLLRLQSNLLKDENVKEIFRETQSRINSMSLIHEKLYEFNDFSKIDYYDYIKELVSQIVNTYDSVRKNLDIKIDIDKIYLNIDTAIPLGLIINELITNSIKYAFNKDEKGEIILSLSKNNDFLTFSVKDNGKGLPQNFNINNIQSLGLRLVNSLTNQIGGELLINNINGVEFIVNFKEIIKRNNIQ